MALILRSSKSVALTHSEMDGNFTNLNNRTTTVENNYVKTINSLTATSNALTITTTNITEGTNLYYTDARARAGVSVTDSGGDGSLSYNSSTGVVTYTGPSATEVRAHFSAGAGITVSSGAISIAADAIKDTMIDWGTGSTQVSTADIPENTNLYYTDARARAGVSVTDSGGDGSLSYNSSTGVVTYTGPSATEVRAHFTAGEGIDISAGAISGEDATAANKGIASFSSDHFDISSGAVTLKANGIDDTHIDWGTGTAQVSTADIPENTNLYYTNARADARITAASIADLSNVTMASLVNGYGLVYNSSSSQIELAELPGAAGGEANQGSNLGGFNEVFKSKTSVTLQFRTLTHDNNITITQSTNYLTIGLGTISSLVATTADINAGTVDAVIGGTTPAAGSFTTINASGVATAVTFEPTADTSASDNAAIGYTSAEGLILTGQGSTSDITFKNDADTTVFTIPTGTDDILFPDNAKAMWGASSDFVIYHSSADSSTYLEESGSGSIYIKASNFYIQDASGTEHIRTVDNSYVMLFHNGSEKLATASTGVDVTGDLTATLTIQPAGDTAAGDNAAIGYTSAEGLILTGQGSTSDIILKNDADATVFTVPTGTDDILFPDNAKAMWGASSDLQIFHNSSGEYSVINQTGTGDLWIGGDANVSIVNTALGEYKARFITDGAAELYFDAAKKLATASTGVAVTGDLTATLTIQPAGDTAAGDNAAIGYTSAEGLILTGQGSTSDITLKNDADGTVFTVPTGTDDILFPDNAKAMWGAGSDLQIYHNGSHSYISDQGTGSLILLTNSFSVQNAAGDEQMATSAEDGAVTLYHDALPKLATSSAGVTVTGNVTATTFVGALTGNADTATKVTVTDSSANTNFPVTFHDESNALLDDTGALRYNPSSGTLLVTNLTVSGTTTTVDTVTMNAANAIIFEGATADSHETTLTITDPTADRTITLPNVTGTIALTSSDITGNAATATTLQTARNIGGVSFNGSANINLPGVNAAGNQSTTGNAATATTATTLATGRNFSITGDVTASAISFNGSGNVVLSAGSVDATTVKLVATNTTDATHFPTFVDTATGSENVRTDTGYTYNPSSGTLTSTIFSGTATEARYADLAELYLPDSNYPIGTVVMIGGVNEITYCSINGIPAGVISDKPAYLMNSGLEDGLPVALVGRVKVRVVGKVQQGQLMRVDFNGVASAVADGASVGIAIEKSNDIGEKLIECLLKV